MTLPHVTIRNPACIYRITLAAPEWLKTMAYLECDPEINGPLPQEITLHVTQAGPFVRLHEPSKPGRDFAAIGDLRDYLHSRLFGESLMGKLPLLHAACLLRGGRRVLLVGPKNAGKSTLTMALSQNGYEIEGDENVFVSFAGVTARPRACRVKEGTFKVLPELAGLAKTSSFITDFHGRKIYNISPSALGAPWRIATGRVAAVVVLHANHGGMSSIRRLPPLELTRALIAETVFTTQNKAICLTATTSLVAGCQGYDLSVGSLKAAINCISTVLDA